MVEARKGGRRPGKREPDMSKPEDIYRDEMVFDGVEIPSLARRQLIGSLVVAFAVAFSCCVATLRPASHVAADVAPHRSGVVRHPSFVTPRVVARMQYAADFR
jgi:hypothetical protein